MKPIVSVITPYKNASKFLPGFVSSLKSQTLSNWICLMVDDGSTDDGPMQLRYLVVDDPRFILLKNSFPKLSAGPASARNCALSHVRTDYVAFCDVDDFWHPLKLEHQLGFHRSRCLDVSVTAYVRLNYAQLNTPPRRVVCPPSRLTSRNLYGRNPIPMLTAIVSTDILSIEFPQVPHEDFLFWLTLFQGNPSIRYGCLPEILGFYSIHSNSVSFAKHLVPFWSYRVYRKLGKSRIESLLLLSIWILDHLIQFLLRTALPSNISKTVNSIASSYPIYLK